MNTTTTYIINPHFKDGKAPNPSQVKQRGFMCGYPPAKQPGAS